jgi:dihydroorotase-like cyclic amidohydrolase
LLAAQVGVVEGFGWEHVARLTAANPARIFRLPRKGELAPGRHADLVVLHPGDAVPVPPVPPYWRVDNGIFRGLPHVPPRVVMQRGRMLAREGTFTGEPAAGRFVPGFV